MNLLIRYSKTIFSKRSISFEIEGVNNRIRIPDSIVFINGIPVVVFDLRVQLREYNYYGRIQAAYCIIGDIPELLNITLLLLLAMEQVTNMALFQLV